MPFNLSIFPGALSFSAWCTVCNWKKCQMLGIISFGKLHLTILHELLDFSYLRWTHALSVLMNLSCNEWAGRSDKEMLNVAPSDGAEFYRWSTSAKWWNLKVSAIFLRHEYLSCSNCHINWFRLTEPDLQHFQNVNFSLWLWCIQVWRPITVSFFIELVHILRVFEDTEITER